MNAVFDAWAVMALANGEPAGARVDRLLRTTSVVMSAVNLGEVYYTTIKERGHVAATTLTSEVRHRIRVEDADWPLVRVAARVKARGGLSYADSFCVATAQRHRAPLYTGDPELLAFSDLVEVVDLRAVS